MRAFHYSDVKIRAKKLLDGYTKKYQSRYNDGFFIDIDGDCVGAISLAE